MLQLTCFAIYVLVTTNFTAYIQRREPSFQIKQSPQRLALNWIVLAVMTNILIYFRLWIMNFDRPTFREMDNPVAAADFLPTRVLSHRLQI